MDTNTPELSSKPVKASKHTKQTTIVPVISAVETIVPTVSAEVIGDIIVGSVVSTLITTPSSQNIDIVAEALAKKQRKEFIESERRRLWHLGYGKGLHLE